MNDSLRTDIFLRFTPETVACACIDLAARILRVRSSTTRAIDKSDLFDFSGSLAEKSHLVSYLRCET